LSSRCGREVVGMDVKDKRDDKDLKDTRIDLVVLAGP
jgi:hypothetical protein